jgi:hypothetical protein
MFPLLLPDISNIFKNITTIYQEKTLVSSRAFARCFYSPSCLEEVFSETGLPVSERLKNSPPLGVTRPAKGDKEEETP